MRDLVSEICAVLAENEPVQKAYTFQGLPLSVEFPNGTMRRWYDAEGKETRSVLMAADYGFVDGFLGADGEEIDVYVGSDSKAEWVYIVHQMRRPDFTKYDEDKVMLGFPDANSAIQTYLKHFDNPGFLGGLSMLRIADFRAKLREGKKVSGGDKSLPQTGKAGSILTRIPVVWRKVKPIGRQSPLTVTRAAVLDST